MNREMVNLLAFVVGTLIAWAMLSGSVHAALAPVGWLGSSTGFDAPTQAKCDEISVSQGQAVGYFNLVEGVAASAGEQVLYIAPTNYRVRYGAGVATASCWSATAGTAYTWYRGQFCVANAMDETAYPDAQCIYGCPSGYTEVNGVCTAPNPCEARAGTVVSSGMYDLGTQSQSEPDVLTCDGQCELSYNGSGVVARQMVGGVYHYFSEGSYVATSTQCAVADAPTASSGLPPVTCNPATQDQGTVNGQAVCLNKQVQDTVTESAPVTNPDGSTTTTKTETNGATGGSTTTTTTTNVDGSKTVNITNSYGGYSGGSGSRDSTGDSFCQKNPSDPSCKPSDDICAKRPETLGCSEFGTVTDSVLGTESRSIAGITAVSVGGAGSCPADMTASFMGEPVTFSWAIPCQAAEWMKPLVLLFTWVAAGLIFIQGVRN